MNRVWIFADFKLPNQKDLNLIEELGFSDVVLGVVTNENAQFKAKYSQSRIAASVEKVEALGARAHVMAWIRRRKDYIEPCCDWLKVVASETGVASVLLDAEDDWHNGVGISAAKAAQLVASKLGDLPCDLGVTGLSNLNKTVRPLLDVCDYGLGQAYSVWKPGSKAHWSHDRSTEPGEQQAKSWASWGKADKPLVMGLSNYWARRPARFGKPPMTVRESLEKALEGSRQVGATEVAYWSLAWLHGTSASRQISREVIKGIPTNKTPTPLPDIATDLNDASAVQWLLVQLGYDLGSYGPAGDGVDGFWGTLSQKALDHFRKTMAISNEGIYRIDDLTGLINEYRKS